MVFVAGKLASFLQYTTVVLVVIHFVVDSISYGGPFSGQSFSLHYNHSEKSIT